MQRLQKTLVTAVILSELTHVFCCGLPVVFSLLSLMAGLGVLGILPPSVIALHDILHAYEIPMIITSGVILALGWGLHFVAEKLDCRADACVHEPCAPKKSKAHKVLIFATLLFVVNVSVYTIVHRGMGIAPSSSYTETSGHENHGGHDNHDEHGHHGH